MTIRNSIGPELIACAVAGLLELNRMSARISVIIPVYNAESHLRQCLAISGIRSPRLSSASWSMTVPRIVPPPLRRQFGALVLSTEGRCGPARARNIGAGVAKGEILLFIDSDVCVHPETLSQVSAEFISHPEIDALMGSYDPQPSAPNFMSQYRNLMHHYVHQIGKHEATSSGPDAAPCA